MAASRSNSGPDSGVTLLILPFAPMVTDRLTVPVRRWRRASAGYTGSTRVTSCGWRMSRAGSGVVLASGGAVGRGTAEVRAGGTKAPRLTGPAEPGVAPSMGASGRSVGCAGRRRWARDATRSEEHTSELQSLRHLVCRLL